LETKNTAFTLGFDGAQKFVCFVSVEEQCYRILGLWADLHFVKEQTKCSYYNYIVIRVVHNS